MAEPVPQSRFERGLILGLYRLFNLFDRLGPTMRWLLPLLAALVALSLASDGGALTLQALATALLAYLIVAMVLVARRPVCAVLPLAVPKALAEAGWTSEACAGRVADVLQAIAQAGRSRELPFTTDPKLPTPSVEIPGTRLTVQAIIDVVALLLGSSRTEVRGEVVRNAGEEGIRVRLRTEAETADAGPVPEGALAEALREASVTLAEQIAPYNLALALADIDTDQALRIAGAAAETRSLSRRQRAACANLRALLLLRRGEVEKGLAAIDAAAEIARPWHPVTLTLRSWRAGRDPEASPELRLWHAELARLVEPYLSDSELSTMVLLAQIETALADHEAFSLGLEERELERSEVRLERAEADGWTAWHGECSTATWIEDAIGRARRVAAEQAASERPGIRERAAALLARAEALDARLAQARPAIEAAIVKSQETEAWLRPLLERVQAEQESRRAALVEEYRRWAEG